MTRRTTTIRPTPTDTAVPRPPLAERLTEFAPAHRQAVAAMMTASPEIADLAQTFPAMLFALATGYASPVDRDAAARMIMAGAPLKEAAAALRLPAWLRRFPAAGLLAPLPRLPSGRNLALRLPALIPAEGPVAAEWLRRVSYAAGAGHDDFALWAAQNCFHRAPAAESDAFVWLTAWAWFSRHAESTAHGLVRRAWHASIGMRRASDEVLAWRRRIDLHIVLARKLDPDWIKDGTALGYDFIRLRTAADFISESAAMDNCLDQYADHLWHDRRQIFSIRKRAEHVADLEIAQHHEDRTIPAIRQLRTRGNRRASAEIWRAAYAWLGSQPLRILPATRQRVRRTAAQRDAWTRLWAPYMAHLETHQLDELFATCILNRPSAVSSKQAPRRVITIRGVMDTIV